MTTTATQGTRPTKGLKFQVKDAEKGLVEAIFATFDVIDHDGDVTLKDAFENGAEVAIGDYGHGSVGWIGAEPPIGKGVIRVTDTDARIEGQLFLTTERAREVWEVIKQMGSLQEWSYWYDPVEWETGQKDGRWVRYLKKLKVYEVCPVLMGAGVDTVTVSAKGHDEGLKGAELAECKAIEAEFLRFERTRARITTGR